MEILFPHTHTNQKTIPVSSRIPAQIVSCIKPVTHIHMHSSSLEEVYLLKNFCPKNFPHVPFCLSSLPGALIFLVTPWGEFKENRTSRPAQNNTVKLHTAHKNLVGGYDAPIKGQIQNDQANRL